MRQHIPGHIRHEQKKSRLLRAVSQLFHSIAFDHKELSTLMVTRVDISADSGICYVFFTSLTAREGFEASFPTLKLFKPSLRSALAREIPSRYVPDLVFMFDDELEKQRGLEALLDTVKTTEAMGEQS